jgi:PleD family two-component response regulator
MRSALERQFFRVTEADNGREGLKKIRANPDLSLVLLDYEMPQMNGFAFLEEMRQIYALDDLAVIGVSSHDEEEITIGFLKHGANDFIRKPFAEDEFVWRVNQNVKLVVQQRRLQDEAFHDYLTSVQTAAFLQMHRRMAESQIPVNLPGGHGGYR